MSAIQAVQRKVFYAPTANRHFFSKRAAAKREASAMMDNKYPTEYPEINWYTGQQITAGGIGQKMTGLGGFMIAYPV